LHAVAASGLKTERGVSIQRNCIDAPRSKP
jgi:hypothetical protein